MDEQLPTTPDTPQASVQTPAPAEETPPPSAPAEETPPPSAAAEPTTSEADGSATAAQDAADVSAARPVARPSAPSPAALARLHPHPTPAVTIVHSESARFGRVDEQGHVFVTDGDEEREVGAYPGGTPDEALQYFARKYDELAGMADLLGARVANPDVPAKDLADGLATLRATVADAHVVGDLPALRAQIEQLDGLITHKRDQEAAARSQAKAAALAEREEVVAQAEKIAGQPPQSTQWKQSGEVMRTLLEQWKTMQRTGPRLDKARENELWQRFSRARNTFDKNRRAFFAELDETRSSALQVKQQLVAEAEALSTSTDWNATARSFKQLMERWRAAGRASRADDDRLWERFKSAQDAFFAAKDEVAHAQDEELQANLVVKEALLVEAEAILPVTDLETAKATLRRIQDRWEQAGKVPRGDLERVEKALRRVEAAVRDSDERRWRATDPEVSARANSMVTQLQANLASLRADLAAAEAAGNTKRASDLSAKIATQEAWLSQAQAVQGDG